MNPKQARFVAEYLVDLNSTQAAIRAGYSAKTAYQIGSRLLKNVEVASAVEAGQAKLAAGLGVTVEKIVAELAKLGFSNMQDYMKVGPDGQPRLHFGDLTRDQAAALNEVTVEEVVTSVGEDEEGNPKFAPVRKVKFKLADKRASLVDLGKHLGMFKDEVKHTGAIAISWKAPQPA